jgi:hypothetical protein
MFFDCSGGWGLLMAAAAFNGGDDSQWQGSGGKEEDVDTTNTLRLQWGGSSKWQQCGSKGSQML